MSYDKRFFQYLIKKYYKVILILFALGFLIVPLPAMTRELVWYGNSYSYTDTYLFMTTIFACAASMILPIVVRSMFLSRKRCDRLLSLPLGSGRIYLLTSVFTYIAFLAVFTVLYMILIVVNTVKGFTMSRAYAAYYGFMFVMSLSIFAETSIIVSLANNVLDAVLLVITEAVAVPLIVTFFNASDFVFYAFFPIGLSDLLTTGAEKLIVGLSNNRGLFNVGSIIGMLVIRLFLGAGLFTLSLAEVNGFKSEKAGDISDKWYSYKLINTVLFAVITAYIIRIFTYGGLTMIYCFFLLAFFFTLEFIYQRKVRFTKGIFIRLAIVVAAGTLFGILGKGIIG